MPELDEFAEALIAQMAVEISEEKEIAKLTSKINEDADFTLKFDAIEQISEQLLPELKQKASEFLGIPVSAEIKLQFPELKDFKKLKGKKVFCVDDTREYVDDLFIAVANEDLKKIVELIKQDTAKFLVYSTYAKMYISKISTTYGDYLNDVIYLNKFILSSYPQIILYKQGTPYESNYENVKAGYLGALKMTILEEIIHSVQQNLQKINKEAVIQVNSINEELAKIILNLDEKTATELSEYLKIQPVPDDFPIAKRANLFFILNPDHFIIEQLGPDVMTYTHVEIDPKISEFVPELLDIYKKWLTPIQIHHAAFTVMEGMAEFSIHKILNNDQDFKNYLTTFMGTDISSYQVRKSIGMDFIQVVFEKLSKPTFKTVIENPPYTKELKEPQLYLKRIQ
ncbi:MAG: hypothetical protein NPMRTH4_1300004 [Nitrosopumilales archaeon]|nr:MAG: hypothetical protein NPMRTH4_1300004 [Nitrosopumilales archaeon]